MEKEIRAELPRVIRALGEHFDPKKPVNIQGEEEKKVAEKHLQIARGRALQSMLFGSALSLGTWKVLGGQRRIVGGMIAGIHESIYSRENLYIFLCICSYGRLIGIDVWDFKHSSRIFLGST